MRVIDLKAELTGCCCDMLTRRVEISKNAQAP